RDFHVTGVQTCALPIYELDRIGHEFLCDHGAYPSTLHYQPHPGQVPFLKSLCTSVNEVICHGIPDSTVLREGDIVNIDVTAYKRSEERRVGIECSVS